MKAFRFPLQKALELRSKQLEIEEIKFQQATAALASVNRDLEVVKASCVLAESDVRAAKGVPGLELAALGAYRLRSDAEFKRISMIRAQRLQAIEQQRRQVSEAQRQVKLLERLRERRLEEWRAGEAKELEEMASESYLAQWSKAAAQAARVTQAVK
ncbi:MAG TPA: hypothetical protein VHW24_07820 [Bryobacteraceae bacterium]|jgi:flagellar export protein FliJ|nr:hypothetical protein [Bryobacteraceae bacterium]